MPDPKINDVLMLDMLGAKYTHNIEACMSAQDFLEQIKLTSDFPTAVLEPGETPGSKTFKGFVRGQYFSLRKKSINWQQFEKGL